MKQACCCPVCKVTGLLVVAGALNWGLVGALHKNAVSKLFGMGTQAESIVYIIIGIAGILKLLSCFIRCPLAKKGDGEAAGDCGHKH